MAGDDTRTDGIMRGTTPTNSVNLGITTKCTMRCPHCSIDVPKRATDGTAGHADKKKVIDDLWTMCAAGALRRVHLTGGEPTMHPEFYDIVNELVKLRLLGKIEYLTIETNGSGMNKHGPLFTANWLFDRVFITHYVKDKIYPGNYDNTHVIEWAKDQIGAKRLIVEPPVEHSRGHAGLTALGTPQSVSPCTKYFDPGLPCGWYDGLLYPCCVSVGIDRRFGRPVTENWRDWIGSLDMGCSSCLYRGT